MSITAVWGPPQSGKTTLAIDLAFALSRQGESVCLISPENYSELSAKLSLNITKQKSLLNACQALGNLKQTVYCVDDLFFLLAVPTHYDAFSEDTTGTEAKGLMKQAASVFDIVLVDCPSHTGSAIAAWALNMADTVILLSGCANTAGLWYSAFRRALDVIAGRTLFVCLQGNDSFDYRSLLSLIEKKPDIWLPYISDADSIQSLRRTLYESGGKSGRTYTGAVDSICSRLKGGPR